MNINDHDVYLVHEGRADGISRGGIRHEVILEREVIRVTETYDDYSGKVRTRSLQIPKPEIK